MGSKSTTVIEPAPAPNTRQIARDNLAAFVELGPQAAQTGFDILTDPNFGVQPTTQALDDARQAVFTGENQVRNQLLENVFSNLTSPVGISPEQQTAIDSRRDQSRERLTEALRTRANLGGNLFGGRSAQAEAEDLANLENLFAEEDIARDERARLNAIQAALPALQILFPDVQITPPQFQNPVPSPNAVLGANTQTNLANQNAQIAQAQAQAQQRSSLFNALGTAGGAAFGGLFCWVASVIFGGWFHPKTVASRNFIEYKSPKWFKRLYEKHGEDFALFIADKPILKALMRPLFEVFAILGQRTLGVV